MTTTAGGALSGRRAQTSRGAAQSVGASPDRPVVVTLVQNGDYVTRGFVTPNGFIIATALTPSEVFDLPGAAYVCVVPT
jgi:hypothetical protein